MGEVISLEDERTARNPHRAGRARCLNCKHEWAAVAPIGTVTLLCPECQTFQGMYKGVSTTSFRQWQCQCGEWSFFIDEISPYCAHCGERPELPHAGPRSA